MKRDYSFDLWVADITEAERDAILDAITDIACAGHGEGDEHVCTRLDWVASSRIAPDDE